MKSFEYTIKDALGIHARPAGMLVKEAKEYSSAIQITVDDKSADATRLLAIMGMGIKCGATVKVTAEGADEAEAAKGMETFFRTNL